MKILVTGGAGFIGHNVVKKLQDQHKVTIVDDFIETFQVYPKYEPQCLQVCGDHFAE